MKLGLGAVAIVSALSLFGVVGCASGTEPSEQGDDSVQSEAPAAEGTNAPTGESTVTTTKSARGPAVQLPGEGETGGGEAITTTPAENTNAKSTHMKAPIVPTLPCSPDGVPAC